MSNQQKEQPQKQQKQNQQSQGGRMPERHDEQNTPRHDLNKDNIGQSDNKHRQDQQNNR